MQSRIDAEERMEQCRGRFEFSGFSLKSSQTSLLDQTGGKLGITADLKVCFPDFWKQLLSIAYYLILEDKNPLGRFPRWAQNHRHPYGESIPSQRSSDIFDTITEDAKQKFFLLQPKIQPKRRLEEEYLAYDTTSIF